MNNDYMSGEFSDIRTWDTALTSEQVETVETIWLDMIPSDAEMSSSSAIAMAFPDKCPRCSEEATWDYQVQIHESDRVETELTCNECDATFKNSGALDEPLNHG